MHRKADLPVNVIVVTILILIILVIILLFVTGTYKDIFAKIADYLGVAQRGLEDIPKP